MLFLNLREKFNSTKVQKFLAREEIVGQKFKEFAKIGSTLFQKRQMFSLKNLAKPVSICLPKTHISGAPKAYYFFH